jgi:hypothetical protein
MEFQEVCDRGWPLRSIELFEFKAEDAEQWLQECVEDVIRPNGDEMFLRHMDISIRTSIRSSIVGGQSVSVILNLWCDSWGRYHVEVCRYRYTQEAI